MFLYLHYNIKQTKKIIMKIAVTPEIKLEIENSIKEFKILIERESKISEDLRYHNKIESWNNKIIELQNAIVSGIL